MRHIQRSEHNETVRGERVEDGEVVLPGVEDLSAKVHVEDGWATVTSHWAPDEDDLKILNEGGVIELDVRASSPPPVRVSVVPGQLEPGAEEAI